jgi:hypothetical protein
MLILTLRKEILICASPSWMRMLATRLCGGVLGKLVVPNMYVKNEQNKSSTLAPVNTLASLNIRRDCRDPGVQARL